MTVEQQRENSPKFRDIEWVSKQVKEELKRFNKEKFYEKNGEEIIYNMDTVKQYLGVLKEKKTWKELISKNSSAMVMAVQIALYSQNYSFGSIDGILGDKTKAAIRKFQTDNNLPVDSYGRSMPSTIQKLLEVISKEDQVEIPEEEQEEAQEIMEEKDKKTDNETKENTGNQSENNENHDDISNEKKDKIGDETLVNQDEIRPEIQELIDSSNINGDRFENVMDLTKAEAIEIANKARGYSINLSGIKKIDVETFEELLNFKGLISIGITDLTPELANKIYENEKKNKNGKLIIFTGLENISNIETYKILGKTYGTLKFLSLKSITEEGMGELAKKPGGDIYLDAIESITPKIAENLLKYPREISLKGIKKIDKQTAEALSQKKEGRICLNGLEAPLDEDVIEGLSKIPAKIFTQNGLNNEVFTQVYNYKKQKEREGKNLSKIVLDVLDNKINISELSKLESITNDDAEFLDKMGKSFYDLSGIKTITPEIFETLLKCRGLIEIGITDLTPELAKKIEESGKSITFAGLEKIDNMETYRILGKTKGILRFKKLKSITGDEMGELVKKPGGDIHFESVEEIDSSIAEKIAVYPRDISFNGVKKIDKETADALSKKKNGIIYLNGLEAPLDEDVIECISKIPGRQLRTNNNVVIQIYDYKKQKEKLEK